MTVLSRRALLGRGAVALAALALGPFVASRASAAGTAVHVRLVQIKATGTREAGSKAMLDKDLEPLRAHLEQPNLEYGRYSLVARATEKLELGKTHTFSVTNGHEARTTVSQDGDRFKVVLLVTKREDGKDSKAKPETVFEATLALKDGATAIQSIAKGLAGGDLVLALTVSRDPL